MSALLNLQELIASSSWFQTWTGAANTAAAKAFAVLLATEAPPTRPFCVLMEPDDGGQTRELVGVNTFIPRGTFEVLVEGAISSGNTDDLTAAMGEARDDLDDFLQMLSDQSGQIVGGIRQMFLSSARAAGAINFAPVAEGTDKANVYESWNAMIAVEWGD